MMHEFLKNNRDDLTRRCRDKVALRPGREASKEQLTNGVPIFLDQLIRTLEIEQTDKPLDGLKLSGPSGGGGAASEMGRSAAAHGKDLMALGLSVDQVVHDYGDLCQAITDLAAELNIPFVVDEFRTLNRCLDNAIANSVSEFSYQHDINLAEKNAADVNEKQGFFVHELRNLLHVAGLSFFAVKTGNLSLGGATGSVLQKSLENMRVLIERSISEVRVSDERRVGSRSFSLSVFIQEIKMAAELLARVQECSFVVSEINADLAVHGNRDLLYSALWNLIQNAFKFTDANSEVLLSAHAVGDRILISVKDHCGGLSFAAHEKMFKSFTQGNEDRTGLGLGLAMARECVESNKGELTVENLPGVGCVFTINLPRHEIYN